MLNELYTFAEPVQVVPFSSLKWGKFTLLHTVYGLPDYIKENQRNSNESSKVQVGMVLSAKHKTLNRRLSDGVFRKSL